MRDVTGFFVSLLAAFLGACVGSVAGVAFARRLKTARARPADSPTDKLGS
jgi:membrane protein DedA with SNARE-associated domain